MVNWVLRLFVFTTMLVTNTVFAADNYTSIIALSSNVNINTATTGATLLLTTESGTRNFFVISVHAQSLAQSGVVTPANLSIGTNPTSYNNIVASTALTGLAASLDLPINLASVTSVLAPNTPVYANVNTAIIGTSQTVKITIIGYYQ